MIPLRRKVQLRLIAAQDDKTSGRTIFEEPAITWGAFKKSQRAGHFANRKRRHKPAELKRGVL